MQLQSIYRCEICGNMVNVLNVGKGTLVCCGQPMTQVIENTKEASLEKHVPIIERVEGGVLVKVGSVAHPMEEAHFIQWIELTVDDVSYLKFLKPGEKPEALFTVTGGESLTAREYCNIHGLWKAER